MLVSEARMVQREPSPGPGGGPTSQAQAGVPEGPADASGTRDIEELTEQVCRRLFRQLTIERERRGGHLWG